MLRLARFAFLVGLSAAISAAVALDPPPKQDQGKQQSQDAKKKAEPAKKKDTPSTDERLDRRNTRMTERNRELDGLLNKKK